MLQLQFDNSHWINIVSQTAWNFCSLPAVSKAMNINHGKEAPPVLCQAKSEHVTSFSNITLLRQRGGRTLPSVELSGLKHKHL